MQEAGAVEPIQELPVLEVLAAALLRVHQEETERQLLAIQVVGVAALLVAQLGQHIQAAQAAPASSSSK
jgi:hypothetical protein